MGLYQVRFLERIPARAAVSESVELVKFARKTSAAPLVNAVLRRCADEAKVPAETLLAAAKAEASRATWLAVLHSHPTWLVERWLTQYGEPQTIHILESNNRPPRVSCHATAPEMRDELIAELERSGLHVSPGTFLRDAFSVRGGSIARSAPFRAGQIAMQDEASQAIPLLLSVEPGQKVLDLCCAPGGKTAILARAAAPNGVVFASDLHSHRLRATRDQLARLGAKNVHIIQLDAARPLPRPKNSIASSWTRHAPAPALSRAIPKSAGASLPTNSQL